MAAIEIYFLIAFLWDRVLLDHELLALTALGAVFLAGAAYLGGVVLWPGVNHERRCVGVFLDIAAVTVIIVMADETGAVFAGLFLWIPIGNGFRFGRWYMHYAQVLSLFGLTALMEVSDF